MAIKVLVIEDDTVSRYVAQRCFAGEGCEVDTVEDGKQALEKINSGEMYKLILVDIGLPDIGGFELAKIMRQANTCSQSKIIALTAHSYQELKSQGNSQIFDKILTKPITPISVVEILKYLFS